MTIQIDSREKPKAIKQIVSHFNKTGTKYFISKLPVGDYISLDNAKLSIDRKQNLSELCGNVCQQHERFVSELKRANEFGIKLIILCEHGGKIKSLESVQEWVNPRLKVSKMAMSGERLYKVLLTLSIKYDLDFQFCKKADTGRRIIEILSNGVDADNDG